MRMQGRPGKSWRRRAACAHWGHDAAWFWPKYKCCIVVPKCLLSSRSTARCHDNGLYHFSTAHCHSIGPYCTILPAILQSKCMRDVTEHVGLFWTTQTNENSGAMRCDPVLPRPSVLYNCVQLQWVMHSPSNIRTKAIARSAAFRNPRTLNHRTTRNVLIYSTAQDQL